MRPGGQDLRGGHALGMQGVERHDGTLEIEQVQQGPRGGDLAVLPADADLGRDHPVVWSNAATRNDVVAPFFLAPRTDLPSIA